MGNSTPRTQTLTLPPTLALLVIAGDSGTENSSHNAESNPEPQPEPEANSELKPESSLQPYRTSGVCPCLAPAWGEPGTKSHRRALCTGGPALEP